MNEFTLSFEEYLEAQKLHLGWKFFTHIAGGIVLSVVLTLFIVSFTAESKQPTYIPIVTVIFVILIFLLVFPRSRKKALRKIYDSQKSMRKPWKMSFHEDLLGIQSEYGRGTIPWKDFYKYKSNDKIIVLYAASNLFYPIPVTAFENEKEKKEFMSILEKEVPNKH